MPPPAQAALEVTLLFLGGDFDCCFWSLWRAMLKSKPFFNATARSAWITSRKEEPAERSFCLLSITPRTSSLLLRLGFLASSYSSRDIDFFSSYTQLKEIGAPSCVAGQSPRHCSYSLTEMVVNDVLRRVRGGLLLFFECCKIGPVELLRVNRRGLLLDCEEGPCMVDRWWMTLLFSSLWVVLIRTRRRYK